MSEQPVPAPEGQEVMTAFVEAYPGFVTARVAALGTPPLSDEVLARGEEWLRSALSELLALPFGDQPRSPLEIFQESMAIPTDELREAGVSPIDRDETAVQALPGDVYGLAPASSAEIGEQAWRAHLAWGAAKAAAVASDLRPPTSLPVVAVVTRNLVDASRIAAAAEAEGFRPEKWDDVGAVRNGLGERRPVAVFVDLEHPEADDAIRLLAGAELAPIAYGPHVDDVAMVRARALGAGDTLARSKFFRAIARYLPRIV